MKIKISVNDTESTRIRNMLSYEREHWQAGQQLIAGVDEAGRGPLAGPVVAAAVIFHENPDIPMIDDSKRLPDELRVYLHDIIIQEAAYFGVGVADVNEIDQLNIFQASMVAMSRAINNLGVQPNHILIDGKSFYGDAVPYTTIVKGDGLSYSIAGASILAKVTRDRIMADYDRQFPHYGFSQHKGYATPAHLDAIEQFGFCSIHRRSFHPKRFMDSQLSLFGNE